MQKRLEKEVTLDREDIEAVAQRRCRWSYTTAGCARASASRAYAPEGDIGHRPQRQLYPIARSDFDRALELLHEEDLPAYEQHVYHAFVRSLERLSPEDPRHHLSMPRSD